MAREITLVPIGVVRNLLREPVDDVWGGVVSRVELDPARFTAAALAGLEEFSHVEILFVFDRVTEPEVEYEARRPRGNAGWPRVGIFAQRARNRPNRLGVTVCRLRSVDGLGIEVEGLDAIDGTPVVDIKPYLREFGPNGEVRQPRWASELMAGYWGSA
jgi:tRNA-Thr(GGU) m(6)t(6)A37 methyltransferase TsaA